MADELLVQDGPVGSDPRSLVTVGDLLQWLTHEGILHEVQRVQGMYRLVLFRSGVPAEITHYDDQIQLYLAMGGMMLKSRQSTETDDDGDLANGDGRGGV